MTRQDEDPMVAMLAALAILEAAVAPKRPTNSCPTCGTPATAYIEDGKKVWRPKQ